MKRNDGQNRFLRRFPVFSLLFPSSSLFLIASYDGGLLLLCCCPFDHWVSWCFIAQYSSRRISDSALIYLARPNCIII